MGKIGFFCILLATLLLCSKLTPTDTYNSLDPIDNITIKWDVLNWTLDGYVAVVTMYNFQHRRVQAPGWTLSWTWTKKEVIWSVVGALTTEQGDCSKFKGSIPDSCRNDPVVVDLLPATPFNMQVENCCKGGVLSSWFQDPGRAISSFQVSVGDAGTANKTVRLPKNFTIKAPGRGYTCGYTRVVKPTMLISRDGRRTTEARMTWTVTCIFSQSHETPEEMKLLE